MHGLTRANYRAFVLNVLRHVPPGVERVNFIPGCSRHSKNEIPLLRPLVMKLAEEIGCRCALMPTNPGILQPFIPPETQGSERTSLMSRVITAEEQEFPANATN
jgi:hypothetical protein